LGDSSPHTLLEILVKKNILLVLVTLLVAMFAAACSPPTPEKLCEGVEEGKRKECTEALTGMKKMLDEVDDTLWPEIAKCLKGKDLKKEEDAKACFTPEIEKKIEEAMKKKAGK
jgi:hypothetical protein